MLSKGSLQGAYIVGEEFGKALEGLSDSRIRHFSSSEALAEYLGTNIISGASILVKGSRGIQMEKVLGCL